MSLVWPPRAWHWSRFGLSSIQASAVGLGRDRGTPAALVKSETPCADGCSHGRVQCSGPVEDRKLHCATTAFDLPDASPTNRMSLAASDRRSAHYLPLQAPTFSRMRARASRILSSLTNQRPRKHPTFSGPGSRRQSGGETRSNTRASAGAALIVCKQPTIGRRVVSRALS